MSTLDQSFNLNDEGHVLRVECGAHAPLPIARKMKPGDILLTHYTKSGIQLHFMIVPGDQRFFLAQAIQPPYVGGERESGRAHDDP